MANETTQPNATTQPNTLPQTITLTKPAPGQTVVVDIQPNQVVEVPFDMAEANITLVGNDLRLEFPGNAVLILTDFAAMVEAGTSPLMMFADGTVVAGDVILTALSAEVPETAAGPGGGSGGAGEYEDDMGALIAGINKLGPQNPDPFAKAVDVQFFEELLAPPAPEIKVGAPPDAVVDSIRLPEGNVAIFAAKITNAPTGATLTLFLSDGTATVSDNDYTTVNFQYSYDGGATWINITGPFDIPAGDSLLLVKTDTVADKIFEGDETFILTGILTGPTGATYSASGTATIYDVDGEPSISSSNATIDEEDVIAGGNSGDSYDDGGDMGEWSATGALVYDFGLNGPGSLVVSSADDPGATWDGTMLTASDGSWALVVNGDGTYTFNLLKPLAHTYGDNTEGDIVLNFTATVTDSDVDSKSTNFTVTVDDDAATAYANTNSANEGQQNVSGNVLTDGTDDVFGADGPTAVDAGVVGVAAGNTGVALDSPATLGVAIETTYGFLTLNANGSYDYDAKANVTIPAGAQDVFTYTIKDGDGDLSYTTLTINLTDSGIMAPDDNDALVYERALDTTKDGSDLVASTYTGSIPAETGETDALNQLNATGGFGTLTYSLVSSANGMYGTIQINSDGSYIYTLSKPFDTSPDADNGANIEQNKDSFTYRVTDANGNWAEGTITVDIVDDKPLYLSPDDTHVEDLATNSDIIENLNFLAGADGVKTVQFTMSLNHGASEANWVKAVDADDNFLTFNGQQLYLFYGSNGTDLTRLEAKTALNGTLGFSIDIDPVTNTYAVHSNGIISNDTATSATNLTGVGGGNVTWKALLDIGGTTEDVMMSTSSGNTVNTNATEIGVSGGNSFTAGEGIRFDFLNGLTAQKVGSDWVFDYPNTDASHNLTKAWKQEIAFVQGGGNKTASIIVTALLADNDDIFYGDLLGENKVALLASNIKIYDAADQLITNLAAAGITIDDSDLYSVTITGLKQGYTYAVFSPDPFTAIQVDAASGTTEFKLGFFSYGEDNFGTPIDLNYEVKGWDNDGDSATGQINLSFYPDGYTWTGTVAGDNYTGDADNNVILGDGGNDTLYGGDGDDVIDGNSGDDFIYGQGGNDNLHGGSGNDNLQGGIGNDLLDGDSGNDILVGGDGDDLFIGGIGNDNMTGGAGADVFAFSAKGGEGTDSITDFNAATDILRFHDVLNNDGDGDLDVNDLTDPTKQQYIELHKASDAQIELTIHGSAAEPTTVTLHGDTPNAFQGITQLSQLNVQVDPDTYSS